MESLLRKVRVFVASPGDLQAERNQLSNVIDEINLTISAIAPEKAIFLELVEWETHVYPDVGEDVQDVINRQIGKYDIFIGIMWKRFGTPTTEAKSGSEEEFRRAYSLWQKEKTLPILFYFCQQPFPPPRNKEDVEQLGKVVEFRDELYKKGLLVSEYTSHDEFDDVIRKHLLLLVGKKFSSAMDGLSADAIRKSPPGSEAYYQQLLVLAGEYENIRKTMEPGDARTRKMEILASKMRSMALSVNTFLKDLAQSSSPGQRLAAVCILQAIQDPDYISWLAERLSTEKPFIGYHAALALLNGVRNLKRTNLEQLRSAVNTAKQGMLDNFGDSVKQTDRYELLTEAEKELQIL